jgi:ribosome-associated heat shock protein Hsp15
MSESESSKIRIDKWLWAARFFKTRSLASDAINGGHVHLNGSRIKTSRAVAIGDELRIQRGHEQMVVMVQALSDKRGPAAVAQTLYAETEASRTAREQSAEQRRLQSAGVSLPDRRPNKHERRNIIRFIRDQE